MPVPVLVSNSYKAGVKHVCAGANISEFNSSSGGNCLNLPAHPY